MRQRSYAEFNQQLAIGKQGEEIIHLGTAVVNLETDRMLHE